jgi:hypothetical protein
MNSENKSLRSGWVYAILALFVLAIIGLSIWLISLKTDISTLEQEKELQKADFQNEVDSMMRVHNEMKDAYGDLSLELSEKDSIIQANADEIKKLLDSQWDYNKIKRKLSQLQVVSQKYVRQLDSLYTVNRELVAENERIREEYRAERQQNTNLVKQKEELSKKVSEAAILRIFNLEANAVRYKGGSRESETDKSGRAERIKIDFTLAQNDLATEGTKTFYVRISDPSKAIIVKGKGDEFSFKFGDDVLQYTEKVMVNYNNVETDVRAYYIKPSDVEFAPGLYFVDVYDNADNLVGQTSFELR